ncbi:MAG: H4MPT-linked C1 transfer pathway protein [Hyphomicrobiales bacterium]|nr:H4MPT-linked C1 transfer pathway protein [Hyphomicrobiales bacterium]
MRTVIGWDIGGAHLKGVRVENGVVTRAVQLPCPLWQGLDKLDVAFSKAHRVLGSATRHAATMTGELADIFATRAEGVEKLARGAAANLDAEKVVIYAGPAGFVPVGRVREHIGEIASANWHASARFVAQKLACGLFVDMGSTTTDLIAIANGEVATLGYTDAERLETGELVYTGMVRSSLMSIAARLPFRGRSMPLMNEYFANMGDVYRILAELPSDADQQATADGREKTSEASRARLARMLGLDARDAPKEAWAEVALAFREAQLRAIHDAAMLVLSRQLLPRDAPVIGAGIGVKIASVLAARLQRPFIAFSRILVTASPSLRRLACDCAPAAAVALLNEAGDLKAGRRGVRRRRSSKP